MDELEEDEAMRQKADIKDVMALNDIKSNKFDTEILMRCVDIQHKQISHVCVLLNECMKTLIKQHKESKMSIQQKRMYILQQSQKVMLWVS
jgi:hypothetical protein